MKTYVIPLMALIAMAYTPLPAQTNAWDIPWSIWLADQMTNRALNNASVAATIEYQDEGGTLMYRESHSGTTNAQGNFVFKVGRGTPLFGTFNPELYNEITHLSYALDVNHEGNMQTIAGQEEVLAVAKANAAAFACDAGNAFSFSGMNFVFQPMQWNAIICLPDEDDYDYFPVFRKVDNVRGDVSALMSASMSDLIRPQQALIANSDEFIDYLGIGLGLGKPMFCGPPPSFIYGLHGITMPLLYGLPYGVDLRLLQDPDAVNFSAAINAQNANAGGMGGRFFGATGTTAFGTNGHAGVTFGTSNGYGIGGFVNDPPAQVTDAFKYAMLASAGGFTSFVYAAALFGTSFTTGPIMTMSDARLKTEVRATTGTLQKIHNLRPSLYHYIDDTPYSLPTGTQYGFLAQEMETTFPELVSEITLPNSFDHEVLNDSGTAIYKSINYTGLIPILTSAIQELDEKVIAQNTEIDILKATISDLTARISALEQQ